MNHLNLFLIAHWFSTSTTIVTFYSPSISIDIFWKKMVTLPLIFKSTRKDLLSQHISIFHHPTILDATFFCGLKKPYLIIIMKGKNFLSEVRSVCLALRLFLPHSTLPTPSMLISYLYMPLFLWSILHNWHATYSTNQVFVLQHSFYENLDKPLMLLEIDRHIMDATSFAATNWIHTHASIISKDPLEFSTLDDFSHFVDYQ